MIDQYELRDALLARGFTELSDTDPPCWAHPGGVMVEEAEDSAAEQGATVRLPVRQLDTFFPALRGACPPLVDEIDEAFFAVCGYERRLSTLPSLLTVVDTCLSVVGVQTVAIAALPYHRVAHFTPDMDDPSVTILTAGGAQRAAARGRPGRL